MNCRFDALDTVRSIIQEIDTSDVRKKELQEKVFVINNFEILTFIKMILETWCIFEVPLQALH